MTILLFNRVLFEFRTSKVHIHGRPCGYMIVTRGQDFVASFQCLKVAITQCVQVSHIRGTYTNPVGFRRADVAITAGSVHSPHILLYLDLVTNPREDGLPSLPVPEYIY